MGLETVIARRRVVVCVGSGGVGKTSTSAALAVHAALAGKRVLCLTIDPARRLATSLGLTDLRADEQMITAEVFARHGLVLRGELAAMMLNTQRTFEELVTRHATSTEARDRILKNRMFKYVSRSLAGTQEYMAMEKLHAVRADPRWDLIVLDTPPSSNALDFLDAPERLVEAIDSPAMRWFVQAFQSNTRFSFQVLGRGAAFVFRGLARLTGTEFLGQVAEFVTGLNDLFGGFRDRARAIAATLRSPEVGFVVVTSPAAPSISEAIAFEKRLESAGMTSDAFVVNGVHPPQPSTPPAQAELAALLAARGPDLEDPVPLAARILRASADAAVMASADARTVAQLRAAVGSRALFVEVPAFERDVHDLGALAQMATHLTAR